MVRTLCLARLFEADSQGHRRPHLWGWKCEQRAAYFMLGTNTHQGAISTVRCRGLDVGSWGEDNSQHGPGLWDTSSTGKGKTGKSWMWMTHSWACRYPAPQPWEPVSREQWLRASLRGHRWASHQVASPQQALRASSSGAVNRPHFWSTWG